MAGFADGGVGGEEVGGAKNDAQGSALGEWLAECGCHLLTVESGAGRRKQRGAHGSSKMPVN